MGQKDVIEVDPSKGTYRVCDRTWVVGTRYKLHEHVGAGSYGDVCRATDLETHQIVALKRIPDVFYCHMLAKRVLREVCIMRRLRHPYIISLTDVFTAENLDIQGGIDLYIATEYADRGDMYHLKDPLLPDDVKLLVWQLLSGVRYLHSCHVWHRDIKSENVLLTSRKGVRICDFGLSRSAVENSTTFESKQLPTAGRRSKSIKPVLIRQYTKTVVTPSYRAPEVIMSQGQYTSAIDIWALGCIFWELLVRQVTQQRTGPPARPLFGVRGEPNTPLGGELYAEDGHSKLSEQLDVIFDVIGTPCWKDIESVPSESWRSYLKQVPGRAGNMISQLTGAVDEEALDLLSRMLAFDPARRCTAEEALAHTYFKTLRQPQDVPPITFETAPSVLPADPVWAINDPALALGLLERELENSVCQPDGGRQTLEWLLQREVEREQEFFRMRQHLAVKAAEAAAMSPALPLFPGASVSTTSQTLGTVDLRALNPACSGPQAISYGAEAQLSLDINRAETRDGSGAQEQGAKKKGGKRKTIIKQGSLRIELNSVPSPQSTKATTRSAKQKLADGGYNPSVAAETLPRRSPRLRETHAQAYDSSGRGKRPHDFFMNDPSTATLYYDDAAAGGALTTSRVVEGPDVPLIPFLQNPGQNLLFDFSRIFKRARFTNPDCQHNLLLSGASQETVPGTLTLQGLLEEEESSKTGRLKVETRGLSPLSDRLCRKKPKHILEKKETLQSGQQEVSLYDDDATYTSRRTGASTSASGSIRAATTNVGKVVRIETIGQKGFMEKIGHFTMVFVENPNMSKLQWIPDPLNSKVLQPIGLMHSSSSPQASRVGGHSSFVNYRGYH
ncbi:hypothetical protein R1flu_012563 [Riccia fluitans]|uniref:Protein kinase domain-containing protein n=1 Tax=Riccia fluitans TaxID=41844 RepID=A0ABD1ZAZ3_9MARC